MEGWWLRQYQAEVVDANPLSSLSSLKVQAWDLADVGHGDKPLAKSH